MDTWGCVEDVLDFAIGEEEAAVAFYTDLAEQARSPMREALLDFAAEEARHKAKLLAVKAGQNFTPAPRAITDLKIADYTVEIEPSAEMTYQQALLVAARKEKAACELYQHLAATVDDEAAKSTFLALADEEARHKLRFESEYDDSLTEN